MRLLLLLILCNLSTWASAQCALEEMINQAPRCNVSAPKMLTGTDALRNEIYKISVVVHVLYQSPAENLPDSLILGQIQYLTRDFRGLNADNGAVRPVFQNRLDDARIEFKLKTIIRKQLNSPIVQNNGGLPLIEAIKVDSLGGSSPLDVKKYLNVWICDIPKLTISGGQGNVSGYATLPNSLPHYPFYLNNIAFDSLYIPGVVLDYATVSDGRPVLDNTSGRTFTGRVLTHEVGHYLGLLHTFDSVIDLISGNACNLADGITDTPPQAQPSQACNAKNTCFVSSAGAPDEPDMFENHMDYSNDQCRVAFTKEQIKVMRQVLENQRKTLINQASGLSQISHQASLMLLPNPFTETTEIQCSVPWTKAFVFQSGGRLLFEFNHQDSPNWAQLHPGLYYLTLLNQQGSIVGIQKLVKLTP